MERIVRNRAQCLECGMILESKHRHDWVQCRCRGIFVDGGREYLRRGGDLDLIRELSEFDETPVHIETTIMPPDHLVREVNRRIARSLEA